MANKYCIFPIGSIYMSINNTNPTNFFGGTWEQLKDRFLLGAGDTYTNGNTGGESVHQLTVSEMPSHSHKVNGRTWGSTGDAGHWLFANGNNGTYYQNIGVDILSTGGGQAHNNMPPYLVVYMWKRIA